MFGIGTTEILVILVVALLVLGPKKLPEIARTLGKGLGEFKRVTTDFQRTITTEVDTEDMEKRKKEAEEKLFGDKDKDDASDEAEPKAEAGEPELETAEYQPDGVAGDAGLPEEAYEPVEELADDEPAPEALQAEPEVAQTQPEPKPEDKDKA